MRRRGLVLLVATLSAGVLAGCPNNDDEPNRDPDFCAGKTATVAKLVDDPPSGATVTWDNWSSKFVNAYCVSCHNPQAAGCIGSRCHTTGDAKILDFRDRALLESYDDDLRCGVGLTQDPSWKCKVGPNVYPRGNPTCTNAFPPPEDRARFVDWVNAGMP